LPARRRDRVAPATQSAFSPQTPRDLTAKDEDRRRLLSLRNPEFCDRRIEASAEHARRLGLADANAATREWERVYRDIIDQAPWLPTVTPTWMDFVSKRVGNYQFHPLWGIVAQQLWVR
jgi:hypothetical protein